MFITLQVSEGSEDQQVKYYKLIHILSSYILGNNFAIQK